MRLSAAAGTTLLRRRSTSARVASDSLGVLGVAWTRTLPAAKAGGATELIPGVAPSVRAKPATAARPPGAILEPPKEATICTGSVPPPRCFEASSLPTRTSLPLGNWASASVPVSIESSGIARVSRIADTPITARQGWAMTRAVHLTQKESIPPSPLLSWVAKESDPLKTRRTKPRTLATTPPGSTRSSSIAISAGSSVVAVRIETATTVIAPSAIERSAWLSTIHRPASETITARPEKVTARPDVASASARAASWSRPRARSSR